MNINAASHHIEDLNQSIGDQMVLRLLIYMLIVRENGNPTASLGNQFEQCHGDFHQQHLSDI